MHIRYASETLENPTSNHYIQCMMIELTMTRREVALEALRYVWKKNPRKARATYLRYMRGCSYKEIAEELNVSQERARQLSDLPLRQMRDHLNRKYGKGIEVVA